jgi:EAL domain-containing protein (putative c-di-GMP-specific phosphodiesterase class I)
VTLESGLRHALERDELLLRYQPIVELATERITGTEALIRWNHPEMGMVPPERFIPLADETGLITGIGAWVLGEACAQVMRWQEHGERGLSMAVNVSARQFADKSLLAIIDRVLEERSIDPQLIDIEITESALMEDVDAAVAMLKRLKRRGIRVSVDDFGTGYSSLNYLKRFPVDTLKVDKTFTRDAARNADDHAIVRAIIALSRSLHLRVVAEGIETVEQLEVMRREGCDYVQGNLYGRPMAPAEVSQLIASRRRRAAAGGNELHLKAAG